MKLFFYGIVAAYAYILFRLSAAELPPDLGPSVPGLDKLAHLLMYGVLATLLGLAMYCSDRKWSFVTLMALPAVLASVYGGLIEVYQHWLPHRSADGWDAVANIVGAFVAQGALTPLYRRRHTGKRTGDNDSPRQTEPTNCRVKP